MRRRFPYQLSNFGQSFILRWWFYYRCSHWTKVRGAGLFSDASWSEDLAAGCGAEYRKRMTALKIEGDGRDLVRARFLLAWPHRQTETTGRLSQAPDAACRRATLARRKPMVGSDQGVRCRVASKPAFNVEAAMRGDYMYTEDRGHAGSATLRESRFSAPNGISPRSANCKTARELCNRRWTIRGSLLGVGRTSTSCPIEVSPRTNDPVPEQSPAASNVSSLVQTRRIRGRHLRDSIEPRERARERQI